MSDIRKYVKKRRMRDAEFEREFDLGYEEFKLGVLLRQVREEAGLTQAQLAKKMATKKSAISRIENHAEDIRLSTLGKFADALGKSLKLRIG